MRVAIYIRTSTEDQNPENQLKECRSINKFSDTYDIYKDQQSAWKDNIERDDFERLKKDIRQGYVKHLIVWDLDRIYRNRKNLKSFFEYCKIYDCKIHSYRQEWLENLTNLPEPFNEIFYNFLLEIMGWMAEDESTKKSGRVKAAVRKLKKGTYSHKGNKWGRKTISTQKINRLKKMMYDNLTYKQMSDELNLSVGVIHKYLTKIKQEEVQI